MELRFKFIASIALLLGSPLCLAGDVIEGTADHYIATDRYTQINTKPRSDQYAPLDTLVTVVFSEDVKTVGDAIRNLLDGSSYQWATPKKIDNSVLDQLALPVVNREMGPTKLRDALSALAGNAWTLEVNEQTRTIWFAPIKTERSLFKPHQKQ